jgi:hypothetical protein
MSDQIDWVPLQKKKRRVNKPVGDAFERATRMIDWYKANRPTVKRLVVFASDYKAFEEAVGKLGVTITERGIRYRDFDIVCDET